MLVAELIQQYTKGRRDFSGMALATFPLDCQNLSGINLSKACLVHTNFRESNLSGANLVQADLTHSCLDLTNFTGADLTNAILTETDLVAADFTNANLQETCLDPKAPVPETDLSELETEGDYVIGYRTKRSVHCGNTNYYKPGSHHVAPYFSVCTETECQVLTAYENPTKSKEIG